MADIHWTPSLVEEYITEAADVLARLPDTRLRGHATSWPPIVREYWEAFGWQDAVLKRPPPSAGAIDRMDMALQWFAWLDPVDSKIVWLRACGRPWKAVCWEVGLARAAAHLHWMFALCVIAWKLNGKTISRRMSKRALIAETPGRRRRRETVE